MSPGGPRDLALAGHDCKRVSPEAGRSASVHYLWLVGRLLTMPAGLQHMKIRERYDSLRGYLELDSQIARPLINGPKWWRSEGGSIRSDQEVGARVVPDRLGLRAQEMIRTSRSSAPRSSVQVIHQRREHPTRAGSLGERRVEPQPCNESTRRSAGFRSILDTCPQADRCANRG